MPTITIDLTDEQMQALEDYVSHPMNQEPYVNDSNDVAHRARFSDADAVLRFGVQRFLTGVLAMCPPQSVKDAQAAIAQARNQVETAAQLPAGSARRQP